MGAGKHSWGAKAGKGKGAPFRHSALNLRFRAVGFKARRSLPKGYLALSDPPGHRSDVALRFITLNSALAKHFPPAYRRSMPKHDDTLSTSSVRKTLSGVLAAQGQQPLGKAEIDAVNSAVNDLSRVRMRTGHVGVAFASECMQHPTSLADAVVA